MNVFRRSWAGFEPTKSPQVTDLVSRRDSGPVIAAVTGERHRWEALEWAAAEAAARQCVLRIVHVLTWMPSVWDPSGGVYANEHDAGSHEAGQLLLDQAVSRARAVSPTLRIRTQLLSGPTASALLREGRRDTLIVMGRGRPSRRFGSVIESVSSQVARRAHCPVAIVELGSGLSHGPCASRVVVGVDDATDPRELLGFAFRAADRRGVGLVMVQAQVQQGCAPTFRRVWRPSAAGVIQHYAVETALHACREAFPRVHVQRRLVPGPARAALIAESAGAALLVLGDRAHGRLHRSLHNSVGSTVLRSVRTPVAIVRTSPPSAR